MEQRPAVWPYARVPVAFGGGILIGDEKTDLVQPSKRVLLDAHLSESWIATQRVKADPGWSRASSADAGVARPCRTGRGYWPTSARPGVS